MFLSVIPTHLAKARFAAVTGVLAASLLGSAPMANAAEGATDTPQLTGTYWTSKMYNVLTGFESRKWKDGSYSEIRFKGCSVSGGPDISTRVDLQRVRSAWPDSHDKKTYKACFRSGSSTSQGEWHGLAKGTYYFRIDEINGASGGLALTVRKVVVDSTKAD
ncbi:hypothetical protein ABZ686_19000 [Streptomyces sp. NPDC006992]|uniref:hypothetical protein n=1 Tax=Streptomyces sp. NPDC006992 TaxID=3155601 RepID=UPI0033D9537B